jgi:hypothetical protein
MSACSPPLAKASFAWCASHTYVPSPLLAFPCPAHDLSHDAWQSKWCTYAPPFYRHGTPLPSCLAEPSNRGKISPPDLSQRQSTPCSHTRGEHVAK